MEPIFTVRVPFEEAFEWKLDGRNLNEALHLHVVKRAEQAGVLENPYAVGTQVDRTVEGDEFVLSVMAEPKDADARSGRIYAAAPEMFQALKAAHEELAANGNEDGLALRQIAAVLRKIRE